MRIFQLLDDEGNPVGIYGTYRLDSDAIIKGDIKASFRKARASAKLIVSDRIRNNQSYNDGVIDLQGEADDLLGTKAIVRLFLTEINL